MKTMKILGAMAAVWVGWVGVSLAGQLNAPAEPTNTLSAMYTLNDIYNRLTSNATATPTAFTEPSAGPTNPTMHTLSEIYSNAIPTQVPRTGCTISSNAFDDGALLRGVPWPNPRFTLVGATGEATNQVLDNLTGLIWTRNANPATIGNWSSNQYGVVGGTCTWYQAFDVITNHNGPVNGTLGNAGSGYGGASDWRLPNINELLSLMNYNGAYAPLAAGAPYFGNIVSVANNVYWSSTFDNYSTTHRPWGINNAGGTMLLSNPTTVSGFVWPVRGGR